MAAIKSKLRWPTAAAACAAALAAAGCGGLGQVEQGRVIAYNPQARRVTLIREARDPAAPSPGLLPPVTVRTPADPDEMGPAPAAGRLMQIDSNHHQLVIFDTDRADFRTMRYSAIEERRNVDRDPGTPQIDRARKTITIYSAGTRTLITLAADDAMLAMPADTWRCGDVVRYYYKDPAQAMRLMNVTQTDLSKSGG